MARIALSTLLLVPAGALAAPAGSIQDLFFAHDYRIPHGQYRIPGLVSTKNGTLISFIA